MSSRPRGPVSAFRLFYDDVVADVRAQLRQRLGTQTVPLPELQREISRLWKESANQEEYRIRAASLRQEEPQNQESATATTTTADDPFFPLYRVRRILSLDDEGPRVNKDTLRALSKATNIFLSHMAARLHKHIVENELSYPVKPEHVSHVIDDPRYLMYQFLACSQEHLQSSQSTEDYVALDASSVISGIHSRGESASDMGRLPANTHTATTDKGMKKRPCSILNYFR